MKHHRHRSHDPGKHLKGRGKAETMGPKLIDRSIDDKAKELPAVGMDSYLEVSIFKSMKTIQLPLRMALRTDWLDSILKRVCSHKLVQARQICHRPPRIRSLPYYKEAAVEPRRGGASSTAPLVIRAENSPHRAILVIT